MKIGDNTKVPIEYLYQSPLNTIAGYSGDTSSKNIQELKATIMDRLLQPLAICTDDKDGKYEVLCGNRRLSALKELHKEFPEDERYSFIPCYVVLDYDATDLDKQYVILSGNVMTRTITNHTVQQTELAKVLIAKIEREKKTEDDSNPESINQRIMNALSVSDRMGRVITSLATKGDSRLMDLISSKDKKLDTYYASNFVHWPDEKKADFWKLIDEGLRGNDAFLLMSPSKKIKDWPQDLRDRLTHKVKVDGVKYNKAVKEIEAEIISAMNSPSGEENTNKKEDKKEDGENTQTTDLNELLSEAGSMEPGLYDGIGNKVGAGDHNSSSTSNSKEKELDNTENTCASSTRNNVVSTTKEVGDVKSASIPSDTSRNNNDNATKIREPGDVGNTSPNVIKTGKTGNTFSSSTTAGRSSSVGETEEDEIYTSEFDDVDLDKETLIQCLTAFLELNDVDCDDEYDLKVLELCDSICTKFRDAF